jgi:hypothetical protein
MKRFALLLGLLVVVFGIGALAQSTLNLTPRIFSTADGTVYLFDNETGATQTTLVVVPSGGVVLAPSDVVVIGGGPATGISLWGGGRLVAIELEVVAGGTVQITLSGDNAGGAIELAWFSLK